ncbi:DUF1540 domain-containing protein [Clostridium perfringens]|uniref:DUF1540 domain-containing protein n=1 Tax=Clostridium perfringens TaxID=1502 RepID=A0AAW9I8U9_CLOPF|nr:DUF1540 domain-containing protein [Clostridium perfringens]MDZ4910828.1 DUF1540 domain-containing protein [Clostridium perfringens]
MQSGNLKCNATNCVHNESSECRAGAINVAGREAITTSETGCSSFVDRSNSGFTNSADRGSTKPQNIKCEASNCKYNENLLCTADDVRINANDASCETFVQK